MMVKNVVGNSSMPSITHSFKALAEEIARKNAGVCGLRYLSSAAAVC